MLVQQQKRLLGTVFSVRSVPRLCREGGREELKVDGISPLSIMYKISRGNLQ
jgi:hypothetical protein